MLNYLICFPDHSEVALMDTQHWQWSPDPVIWTCCIYLIRIHHTTPVCFFSFHLFCKCFLFSGCICTVSTIYSLFYTMLLLYFLDFVYLSLFLSSFHHVFTLILVLCVCVWMWQEFSFVVSAIAYVRFPSQGFMSVLHFHWQYKISAFWSVSDSSSLTRNPYIWYVTMDLNPYPVLWRSQPIHQGPAHCISTILNDLPSTLSSCYPLFLYLDNTLYLSTWLIFLKCLTIKMKVLWSLEMSGTVYPVTW